MESIDWMSLAIKIFLGILTSCFALEVTPIKINPISWFCGRVSKNINKDRDAKLNEISKKLDEHIDENYKQDALNARTNIIRFSEDLKMKKIPSQEHFDIILEDIDFYEKYCESHPNFPNNKCNIAIKYIKDMYNKYCFT